MYLLVGTKTVTQWKKTKKKRIKWWIIEKKHIKENHDSMWVYIDCGVIIKIYELDKITQSKLNKHSEIEVRII